MLSRFFEGELDRGRVYLVYGEEKTGKTSLALHVAMRYMQRGEAVMWVDCGERLYLPRLEHLLNVHDVEPDLIYLTSPKNFDEQEDAMIRLSESLPRGVGLIVCDDLTYLHRLATSGDVKRDMPVYRRLAFQTALLKELIIRERLSSIIVGQVHDVPAEPKPRLVAGRIVGYWSDFVIRVENAPTPSVKVAILEKPSREEQKVFRITEDGVRILR